MVYSALLACIFACSIIKAEWEGDRGMLKAWRPLLNILIPSQIFYKLLTGKGLKVL